MMRQYTPERWNEEWAEDEAAYSSFDEEFGHLNWTKLIDFMLDDPEDYLEPLYPDGLNPRSC